VKFCFRYLEVISKRITTSEHGFHQLFEQIYVGVLQSFKTSVPLLRQIGLYIKKRVTIYCGGFICSATHFEKIVNLLYFCILNLNMIY